MGAVGRLRLFALLHLGASAVLQVWKGYDTPSLVIMATIYLVGGEIIAELRGRDE